MPLPFSKSQVDKLGQRLAAPGPYSDEDASQLEQVLIAYAGAVAAARQALEVLENDTFRNVSITGRAKTTQTTLEKLVRNKSRLSSIEDLAGVRIVADMTLSEQDSMAARVIDLFGGPAYCRLVDRRSDPRAGYRAVHVIVKLDGLPVEVQIRTRCQDAWANLFEKTADAFGRGIRYGEPPIPTGNEELDTSLARTIQATVVMSDATYEIELLLDQSPDHAGLLEDLAELPGYYADATANIVAMKERRRLRLLTDKKP